MSYIQSAGGSRNLDFIDNIVEGPYTITDFRPQSGLWLPVYNEGAGAASNVSFSAPDYSAHFTHPGPNPGALSNEQYYVALRPRFRVFPDRTTGLIKIRIEMTA